MTGINSAVTGKFTDPPVIMTGITSRFISRPGKANVLVFCPSLAHFLVEKGAKK